MYSRFNILMFQVFLLTVCFGLFHGLILLPILLSIMGNKNSPFYKNFLIIFKLFLKQIENIDKRFYRLKVCDVIAGPLNTEEDESESQDSDAVIASSAVSPGSSGSSSLNTSPKRLVISFSVLLMMSSSVSTRDPLP